MFRKEIYLWRVFCFLAWLGLTACDSQSKPTVDQVVLDGTSIQVPLPAQLREISAIDPAAVTAVVTVNGIETELQRAGQVDGQFTGQITVPARSSFTVVIDFYENFSGLRLNLARAERAITTTGGNTTLSLQSEDYDFNSFDFDSDNASNLLERQFNTNPLDSSQLPEFIEIEVFAALPVEATSVGFNNYQIEASVGAETVTTAADNGQLNHTFRVVKQDSLTIDVRLIESVTGQGVVIGTQTRNLVNPPEFSQIIFDGTAYNLDSDRDADGLTDLDELIAGTDLLSAQVSNQIPFTVLFDVPAEISDPSNVFAILEINGSNVSLSRVGDTYTGTSMTVAGSSIDISVQLNDTLMNDVITLATFNGQAQPSAGETLQLEGFSLQIDTDNDGIFNYLELAQGSDPFNPPELSCTTVSETVFATLTDDGFQQNNRFFDTNSLQVSANRKTILIRYSRDESLGTVTAANLNLTVTTDEGDGLLSVFAVDDFEWSDTDNSVDLPLLGAPVGSLEGVWQTEVEYSFNLNPDVISSDFTLFITQSGGNDVAFGSSDTVVPPSLQIAVERCE